MLKEPIAQYIVNTKGKRTGVVLDIKVYEEILEALDDYFCARAYKRSKVKTDSEIAKGEFVTLRELRTNSKRTKKVRAS